MRKIILIALFISSLNLEAQYTGTVTTTRPTSSIASFDVINSNNISVARIEASNDNNGYMWLKDSNGSVKAHFMSNSYYPSSMVGELVVGELTYATKGKKFYVNGNSQFTGNVGIGTNIIPTDFKLAVAGKIIAEELKVQLQTAWPDYVFTNEYQLPTLQEVEKQIQENGHLENIPSACEVQENGIEVGEMNRLLLEKIEELTLYTIDQQKQLNEQAEIAKNQAQEIEELKALVNTLVQKNK